MDLNSLPLMQSVVKRMKWLTENQDVVAQNIANADTPGYKAKALKEPDFQALLRQTEAAAGPRRPSAPAGATAGRMATTHAGHLSPAITTSDDNRLYEPETFETGPDGNNVALEEQLMAVAKNQMDYSLMTRLYRKHVGLLKTALGSNSN